MISETTLTVTNTVGLHARPAAALVKLARTFASTITIQNLSRPTTKAVGITAFNLLQIGVKQGHEVRLRAEGDDAATAIAALEDLFRTNFGE